MSICDMCRPFTTSPLPYEITVMGTNYLASSYNYITTTSPIM